MNTALTDNRVEKDVLDRLARVGPLAAQRAKDEATRADSTIRAHLGNYHHPYGPNLRRLYRDVGHEIATKRTALSDLGTIDPNQKPAAGRLSPSEELHETVQRHGGQRAVDDHRAMIASQRVALRQEIAVTENKLANVERVLASSGWTGTHSEAKALLRPLSKRLLEARDELAALEQDEARRPQIVGEAVRAVFIAAGGAGAVATALAQAARDRGQWTETDHEYGRFRYQQERLADAERRLQFQNIDPSNPPERPTGLAAQLLQMHAEHRQAVDQLKSDMEARAQGRQLALVEAASRGDESARSAIEQAARACPVAFPPNFAGELRECQWERLPLAAAIHSAMNYDVGN